MIQTICLIVAIYVNVRLWQTLAEPPCKGNAVLNFATVVGIVAILFLTLGLLASVLGSLGPYGDGFSTIPVKIMETWR